MRPGKALVVALAVLAASCGGTAASDDAPAFDVPDSVTSTQIQANVTAGLETSLASEALVPASCVEGLASEISGILFADLGEAGLRNLGVTSDDASVVGTNGFFAALPASTKGRVVAAVAACDGTAFQLSPQIPGVSYASFTCLIDRLSATGFFEDSFVAPSIEQEESVPAVTFAKAKAGCLELDEIEAYDAWAAGQRNAPRAVALAPVSCVSIDPAPFAAVLGFDIDEFEPSVIRTDSNRPVGCAYGDPDGAGPWVMLYVATQDFQRGLYEAYEPSIPEVAKVWPDLSEILDYAGVYFIASGGTVEWTGDAVTATFADGNTSAAVTAGDYVLMVSAGPGGEGAPLSRDHLAGAVETLAQVLALS